jgi:very-short-patch-repair endonuclease
MKLWYHLRRRMADAIKFCRQHPLGPYILDFYCPSAQLVVEVDGGQHLEPENARLDRRRTLYLESRGLRVLRFTNLEVLQQTDAVIEAILTAGRTPPPNPPQRGEGMTFACSLVKR